MAKKLKSYRLDEELLAEIDTYAVLRKVSATEVIEGAVRDFLDLTKGGVPDLPGEATWKVPPSEPSPKPAAPIVRASSLLARQRANPVGMSRQDRVNRLGQGPGK